MLLSNYKFFNDVFILNGRDYLMKIAQEFGEISKLMSAHHI
jgi:hypothetical protein